RTKNQVRRDPASQAAPFPERRPGQRAFFVINWGDGWERAFGGGLAERALLGAPLFAKKGQAENLLKIYLLPYCLAAI
ncbi:MAG: hypothetical protein AAFQ68_20950, partial [Bacteroidota bacterium]